MANKRGRPSKADLAARSNAEDEADRRVAARAGSFATVLYEFLKANSATFEGVEEGQEPDASAAALYLKEYIETLHNLERGLPPLPSNPDSGPWSLIERDALDVVANEPFNRIAARYGVNENSMYTWSKRRRWKQRRALLLELQARQSTAEALVKHAHAVPSKPAKNRKSDRDEADELQDLVRRCITVFETAMQNGQVQFKTARDMETLIKLLGWLQGRADKIVEHQHHITIQDMEITLTKIVKRMRFTPEMAGVVQTADYTVIGQEEPVPMPSPMVESGA